jgi:hypothetical protein
VTPLPAVAISRVKTQPPKRSTSAQNDPAGASFDGRAMAIARASGPARDPRRIIRHPNTSKAKNAASRIAQTECESVDPRYLEKNPNH